MVKNSQTAARRIEKSIISNSSSGRFLIYAILTIGILVFLNSSIMQIFWILEINPDFKIYKYSWTSTQILLLVIIFVFRLRLRPDAGITILERVGFRLLILNIIGTILISIIVFATDWIKPIATNSILAFIHFLCMAVVPSHITNAFIRSSFVFLLTGMLLLLFPLVSDGLYGLCWFIASLIMVFTIKRETGT